MATAIKRTALVFSIIVVLLLAFLFFWRIKAPGATPRAEKASPVTVVAARQRTVANYFDSIATVQAFNTVVVHPRVDGLVERVRFQEGRMVRRGEILVELDPRPFEVQLRAARAQQQKDVAQFDNMKRDVARYEVLASTDSGTAQTLDAARAQLAQLAASLAGDQAQIDLAQLQLGYATIRSPINGRLGARLVDAGNVVHISDTNGLVVVSQLRPAVVSFSLPQAALPTLREQLQRHRPQVLAFAAGGQKMLGSGELTFIDSQIDGNTGTIRCKATFANDNEALWPGAFVTVHVVLNDIADAVVVPSRAVQAGAQQPYVFIVTAQNVAEMRNVATSIVADGETVIVSGLHAGEQVVLEGQFQLENGAHVAIQTASSPSPAGAPGIGISR